MRPPRLLFLCDMGTEKSIPRYGSDEKIMNRCTNPTIEVEDVFYVPGRA